MKRSETPRMLEEMYSLSEVAKTLRCHTNTVRAWVRKGLLVPVKSGQERTDMFRKVDVLKLKKDHGKEELQGNNDEMQDRNDALEDTEERLRLSTTTANVGIWDQDLVTGKVTWSEAMYAIHGVLPEGFVPTSENLDTLIHPEDRERVKKVITHALEHETHVHLEYRGLRPDGNVSWLHMNASVMRANGRAVRMLGALLDISERKAIEISLAERTTALETMNSVGSALIAEMNTEKIVQAVTDAAREVSGAEFGAFFQNHMDEQGGSYMLYTLSGIPRKAFERFPMPRATDLFGPTFRGEGPVRIDDVSKDHRYGKMPPYHGMPEGHPSVRSFLAVPVISREGNVLGGLFFGHKEPGRFSLQGEEMVTALASQAAMALDNATLHSALQKELEQQRIAEVALRESEQRYRELLSSLPAAVFTCDLEGRILLFNQAAVQLWGGEPEIGVVGRWTGASAMFDRDGHLLDRNMSPIALAVIGDRPVREEFIIERPDGTRRGVLVNAEPMRNTSGEVVGGHSVLIDITERKLGEERLRVVTETGKLGIWDWDLLADQILWTEPVYEIHGVTKGSFEPTMSGYRDLIHPDDRDKVARAIKAALEENTPYEIEFRTVNIKGDVNWVFTNATVLRDQGRPVRMLGATMNITQRKKDEEAAQRLAAIVESSEDAIIGVDLKGIITNWNEGAEKLFGYQEEEVIGNSITMLLPPDRTEEETKLLGRIVNGERVEHFETKRQRKDGTVVDVTLGLSPIKDDHGVIIGAAKIARDITANKRAEEDLRTSEQRFHLLADNVSQLVWMAEADGSTVWFNKRWHEFTGMTSEEIREKSRLLHHPDHYERATSSLNACAEKGEPWDEMFPLKGSDGKYHWFLANAMPVKDEDGRVVRWFGTCTDITTLREAQEQVRESEERFRLLADNIGQLAWIAEPNGDILWYNKRWFDYSGTTLEEMKGWGWQRIYHPDHVDRVSEKFKEHLKDEQDWEDIFPIRGADGEYRWFLSRAFPVRNSEGVVQRWFGTNTDVTEQKNVERKLAEVARNKDHFLATLAHELRGPLAPLKNGLQLMEMATDDPVLQENTRGMMVRQLDHMVRLVDDLMDLSRISRGKIKLTKSQVTISDVVATAMETSRPLIERKEHQLEVELGPRSISVHGDRDRLTQVVANLLTNAAKYTPDKGRITLTVEVVGSDVVLSIKDNGIGIEPQFRERVFDMFAQVDPEQKTHVGSGLGIGLNIVQRLMHMHGGSVTATSEGLGKGSEFTLRLPCITTPLVPLDEGSIVQKEMGAMRRVLVVDDNEDAALSMSLILKKRGHTVHVAHDGQQAVAAAAEFKPEILIMDIGMPRMNGYEACSAIRNTKEGKDIFIVALSGWGQEEDRQKSKDAGFDRHVVKPIDTGTLERVVAERVVRPT